MTVDRLTDWQINHLVSGIEGQDSVRQYLESPFLFMPILEREMSLEGEPRLITIPTFGGEFISCYVTYNDDTPPTSQILNDLRVAIPWKNGKSLAHSVLSAYITKHYGEELDEQMVEEMVNSDLSYNYSRITAFDSGTGSRTSPWWETSDPACSDNSPRS